MQMFFSNPQLLNFALCDSRNIRQYFSITMLERDNFDHVIPFNIIGQSSWKVLYMYQLTGKFTKLLSFIDHINCLTRKGFRK